MEMGRVRYPPKIKPIRVKLREVKVSSDVGTDACSNSKDVEERYLMISYQDHAFGEFALQPTVWRPLELMSNTFVAGHTDYCW